MSYICPVCQEWVKDGEEHYHPVGWLCLHCNYVNGPKDNRCVKCNRKKSGNSVATRVPWTEVK